MSAYSFLAGMLTGIVVTGLAITLWQLYGKPLQRPSLRPLALGALGGLGTFAIAAGIIYLIIARTPPAPDVAQVSPTAPHPGASGKPESMQAATAGLAARLAREGGTPDEWELLARSYDFLGMHDKAREARQHEAEAASASPPTMESAMQAIAAASQPTLQDGSASSAAAGASEADEAALMARTEAHLKKHPKDVKALLTLATLDTGQRKYGSARDLYAKVIALKGMNAEAWADYADVLAALAHGSLGGAAGRAIERSLALDPTNEKGLWLKASQAYQEHRYADALALWKTLRATLPASSPDAQMVDNNIAEATRLVGGNGSQAAGSGPVAISGTVSIDSHLAGEVNPQDTLFIYAQAVGSPGPPLAVMRTPVGAWPVSFRLDDSMAMVPFRRLSQFNQVFVEARVSASGQALPAAGDLYAKSGVIKPGEGKPLKLVISHRIS